MTTTKEKTLSSQPSNVSNIQRSGKALLPPTYHVGMADQPIIQAKMMVGPFIQSKLTVNQPGDVYEREADAVADKVMRMPDPSRLIRDVPSVNTEKMQLKPMPFSQITRKCATCGKEDEDKHLHRKETSDSMGGQIAPPIVSDVIGSSGQALDKGTRQFMESRMGHDFSNVQIHTDSKAAESASAVNALAYTSGQHIVFNSGQYAPNTEGGKRLLAHELVHTMQQDNDKIKRYIVDLGGWGGTYAGDDSYIDIDANVSFWQNSRIIIRSAFTSSRLSTNLEPGFAGIMQLQCHIYAFRDMNFNNEEGEGNYLMNCPISVDSEGNINIRECSIEGHSGIGDGSISFEVNDVQPSQQNHLVTRGLRIRYSSTSSEGHSFGVGGELSGEPGGVGVGASGSYSREYSMGDPRRGILDLLVDIMTPNVPRVEIGAIRVIRSRDFYFDTGSAALRDSETERLRLISWMRGLDLSADGGSALRFTVTGYASNLGTVDENQRLSLRRAEAIHQIIRTVLPRADFATPIPLGELSGFEAGRLESDNSQLDRLVRVSYERVSE